MSETLEWMKSIYTKAEENAFVWKPIYPNNMPCNGVDGIYTDMFFKEGSKYHYMKFSIEYCSRCDEEGLNHPEEGIKYYVLHELQLRDLDEPFVIPEPSNEEGVEFLLGESRATLVNDYGRFRYVFDDEETAKNVVKNELKMMLYPYLHILDEDDLEDWKNFILKK